MPSLSAPGSATSSGLEGVTACESPGRTEGATPLLRSRLDPGCSGCPTDGHAIGWIASLPIAKLRRLDEETRQVRAALSDGDGSRAHEAAQTFRRVGESIVQPCGPPSARCVELRRCRAGRGDARRAGLIDDVVAPSLVPSATAGPKVRCRLRREWRPPLPPRAGLAVRVQVMASAPQLAGQPPPFQFPSWGREVATAPPPRCP